jgi:3-hydroxy-3-methylglutaryl CoA synthase
MMFSYGSGLAATMFSVQFRKGIENIVASMQPIKAELATRRFTSAEEFSATMDLRHEAHGKAPYQPKVRLTMTRVYVCVCVCRGSSLRERRARWRTFARARSIWTRLTASGGATMRVGRS